MDLNSVISYTRAYLQSDSRFSDIDMSENSAFYQIYILPFSIMAKSIFDLNDETTQTLQLGNYQTLTTSEMDFLAENFLVTRRQASNTTLQVKIYFNVTSSPVDNLIINTTDTCRTNANLVFNPITNYIFIYTNLPFETYNGVNYRVAVINTQSSNAQAVVPVGAITGSSFINSQIAIVTNTSESSQPVTSESNTEFFNTINSAITQRNNVNEDSILVNYKNKFPTITDIFSTGYGDPEMQRDIAIASKCWSGHFGGMVDIFTRGVLTQNVFSVQSLKSGGINEYTFYFKRYKGFDWQGTDGSNPSPNTLTPWVQITLPDGQMAGATQLPIAPLIIFDWQNTTIGNLVYSDFTKLANGEVDFTLTPVNSKDLRYSIYEQWKISVRTNSTATPTNPTVNLSYYTDTNLESYQQDINQDANRVICANYVFKSFIPVYIRRLVVVYDKNYTVDESLWASNISNIINSWSLREPIRLTTLLQGFPAPVRIDEIYKDSNSNMPVNLDSNGNITSLNTITPGTENYPTYAEMVLNNIDGTTNVYASTRQLSCVPNLGLSASIRTIRYFINPTNIVFIKGTW